MIVKRRLINFGKTISVLAALLLVVLVLTSAASAGNYAKKQSDPVVPTEVS